MVYCEILSGIWIGDINILSNINFINDNNISIIINCTKSIKFPNINCKKIRLALSDSFLEAYKSINENKQKILELLYNNMDTDNILIVCYDGERISPYIISLFIKEYGNIPELSNIKKIILTKNSSISLNY